MYTKTLTASSVDQSSTIKDFLLVAMGTLLLTLCAPLSFKLPFTPVPLAVAPHMAILLGFTMGPRRGALAVLGYLLEGAMGLPVFALGASGFMHLLGARGGYLIGYALAAYVTGFVAEKMQQKSGFKVFLSLALGNAVIYLFGVSQLSLFVGMKTAFFLGCAPFLAGDFFKLMAIYMVCQKK